MDILILTTVLEDLSPVETFVCPTGFHCGYIIAFGRSYGFFEQTILDLIRAGF